MSVLEIIIRLAAVALFAGYLFIKHRQRVRNWSGPKNPAEWTGRAIDATRLRPTIDRVRHDYLAARQPLARGIWYRKALLALAGRTVGRLSFFRDRKCEEEADRLAKG
jgi:hypothetical protein